MFTLVNFHCIYFLGSFDGTIHRMLMCSLINFHKGKIYTFLKVASDFHNLKPDVWIIIYSYTRTRPDLIDKMKRSFFQAAVVSILLYGCTSWTLTKRREKKFDGNYTRMLRAILNKSWRKHPTKQQLYGHFPPITKTIQVRRTRHAGHCWRSREELIWRTPVHPFTWTSKGRSTS